jgi:hypothetical protein
LQTGGEGRRRERGGVVIREREVQERGWQREGVRVTSVEGEVRETLWEVAEGGSVTVQVKIGERGREGKGVEVLAPYCEVGKGGREEDRLIVNISGNVEVGKRGRERGKPLAEVHVVYFEVSEGGGKRGYRSGIGFTDSEVSH